MLNVISVELTPSPNYQIPVQPITAVAQELFPEILSTKKLPLKARDVMVYDNTADVEYYGGADLLVTVSVQRTKELKAQKDEITQLLTKALVDVLGDTVDIELRLFFMKAKFTEVAVATSDQDLPALEAIPEYADGLDRVFRRLILDDPALELDTSTDTIRVLSEADRAPREPVGTPA